MQYLNSRRSKFLSLSCLFVLAFFVVLPSASAEFLPPARPPAPKNPPAKFVPPRSNLLAPPGGGQNLLQPGVPPCTFSPGFAGAFYETTDLNDLTTCDYRLNLTAANSNWSNSTSPARNVNTGSNNDNQWSATFDTIFSPPIPEFVVLVATYSGYLELIIDSNYVYVGSSPGSGTVTIQAAPSDIFSTTSNHTVNIRYVNDSKPQAKLYLEALWCTGNPNDPNTWSCSGDTAPPPTNHIAGPFYACGTSCEFSSSNIVSFDQKPQDITASPGPVQFNVNFYAVPGGAITWTKNSVAIPGANTSTLNYVAQPGDNGAIFRANIENPQYYGFIGDRIKGARLTINQATPTPTLTPTPTSTTTSTPSGNPTPTPSGSGNPTPTPTPTGNFACDPADNNIALALGENHTFHTINARGTIRRWESVFNGLEWDPDRVDNSQTFTTHKRLGSTTFGGFDMRADDGVSFAHCVGTLTQPTPTPSSSPTPTSTPTQTPSGTPVPTATPAPDQPTTMWAFDRSPIDPQDRAYPGVVCHPTPVFPSGECEPHLLQNPPPILRGVEGLVWGLGSILAKITVVAANPDLTVRDSTPSADNAAFDYPSRFLGSGEDVSLDTQVGQVNAYQRVMALLKEFSNTIWPLGPDPEDSYYPRNLSFENLSIVVAADEEDDSEGVCGADDSSMKLSYVCALSNFVIDHEFNHYLMYNVLEQFNVSGFEGDSNEVLALFEGLGDFWGLRNTDGQHFEDYFNPKIQYPFRDVLALDSSPGGPDGQGAIHTVFRSFPLEPFVGIPDPHLYGAKIGNILLSMRKHIIDTGGGPNNTLLFDRAVVLAGANLASLGNSEARIDSLRFSMIHLYYVELYKMLDFMSRTQGFRSQDVAYFRDNLLDGKAHFAVSIGNTIDSNAEQFFFNSGCFQQAPRLLAVYPVINSIGGKLNQLTVTLTDVGNPANIMTKIYDANSTPVFHQEFAYSPISEFADPNFLITINADEVRVTFTATDDAGHSTTVEVPGTLQIPTCQ